MESNEGVLYGVLCRLAAAQHDDSETEELGVMPSEQHLDDYLTGRLRDGVKASVCTPLGQREHFLRNGVRHAQESLAPPARLTSRGRAFHDRRNRPLGEPSWRRPRYGTWPGAIRSWRTAPVRHPGRAAHRR